MVELENVLEGYLETKRQTSLVPGRNSTPALQALRQDLPEKLRQFIKNTHYDSSEFHVKGSAGEPNRSFAKVPWVAVFKNSISRSATQGYYIVFLFAEDMSSVTMSLNQGYTAFKDRYIHPDVAYPKLEDCALAALSYFEAIPTGYDLGPIDLHAEGHLGKGYEAGSILSKTYDAGATPDEKDLQTHFLELFKCFLTLANEFPKSLIDLDVEMSERQILEAASKVQLEKPGAPKTSGPQPPPHLGFIGGKAKHVRSVEIVASAFSIANAACSLEESSSPHIYFPSAKTRKNYVEAHHFIPFSQQSNFEVSLDVEENIAVLCPNCHRMLHHGTSESKTSHLKSIFQKREASLKTRGIIVSLDELLKMYKVLELSD